MRQAMSNALAMAQTGALPAQRQPTPAEERAETQGQGVAGGPHPQWMPRMKRLTRAWTVALALLVSGLAGAAQDVSVRHACQEGDAHCVRVVVREMRQRFRTLAKACDHDAVFALLYLRTTETFGATLDTINYTDPASVVREDALFADSYFQAYDAYHRGRGDVPLAWQIAFTAAHERAVVATGNALLGINAHIQRDLPFTLYELDVQGTPISYEDHTLVNDFLAQVDATVEIAQRFDPTFDDNADPPALQQLIVAWREQAFVNFVRLRDAPTPEARARIVLEIEVAAGATAGDIAQATAYPPGTDSVARDVYCAAQKVKKDK
jgi:hypothetical protein